jgi:hypothetical protein
MKPGRVGLPLMASNIVLQSNDMTQAAWTKNGTGTAVRNATGIDGTSNTATTLTDSDAAAAVTWSQPFTVPVDGATHCAQFWIAKDAVSARSLRLILTITGGTAVTRSMLFRSDTGVLRSDSSVGTGTSRVVDRGLWWVVEITVTNNSTAGNTSLLVGVSPAAATGVGAFDLTITGSAVVGHVGLEKNKSTMSLPVVTGAAAIAVSTDVGL